MKKTLVGYCNNCRRQTKHTVVECEDSLPWRVFETVTTLGWGLLLDHEYKCECSRCGEINSITK